MKNEFNQPINDQKSYIKSLEIIIVCLFAAVVPLLGYFLLTAG